MPNINDPTYDEPRESGDPDIVIYPDSGKVGAFERLPDGGGLRAMFRVGDKVDYHEGEQPPR
jgi:hypothetical protein